MAFTLPQFNLLCDIWESGANNFTPTTLLSSAVRVQLYVTDKFGNISMRFPKGTDVRPFGFRHANTYDLVNIQPPSQIWMYVNFAGPMHRGFPNEYFAAWGGSYAPPPTTTLPWP